MNDIKTARENYDLQREVERVLGQPTHRGKTWTWKCPFHADDTPSFNVYKNGYHCFGCGTHGDVFDWFAWALNKPLADVLREKGGGLTPEQITQRRLEIAERDIQAAKEKIEKAERAIKEIREEQNWIKYHENLNCNDGRPYAMLASRGIPEWLADYRQFGYDENHRFQYDTAKNPFFSPTLTIPYLTTGTWECVGIRHRLLGDFDCKYLPEKRDVPQYPFVVDPAKPIEGRVVLWEGEFKASVLYATDPDLNVIGLPGDTPNADMLKHFDRCDEIILGLDPDAFIRPVNSNQSPYERTRDLLGRERVRYVKLPQKVDDMITGYELGRDWLRSVLQTARKA